VVVFIWPSLSGVNLIYLFSRLCDSSALNDIDRHGKKPVANHSTVSPVFPLSHLYAFPAVVHSVVFLPYGMVDLPLGVAVAALISSL
jgi:hypothetical protein